MVTECLKYLFTCLNEATKNMKMKKYFTALNNSFNKSDISYRFHPWRLSTPFVCSLNHILTSALIKCVQPLRSTEFFLTLLFPKQNYHCAGKTTTVQVKLQLCRRNKRSGLLRNSKHTYHSAISPHFMYKLCRLFDSGRHLLVLC